MKRLRIPPLAIAAIGCVVCLLALGLIFGLMIKPTQDSINAQKARYDAAYPDSTPGAQAAAQKKVAAAVVQVNQTKYQWAVIENRLMPRYNVSLPLLTAWQQLSNELTYNLGPDIERYIPTTGVYPMTTVSISAPPASPNAITNAPLVIPIGGSGASGGGGGSSSGGYPGGGGGGGYSGGGGSSSGSITVGGDFRHLLYHVLKWNDFNRLVLIDGLSLQGNSPFMTASYNAKVIIFPQGDDNPAKPILAAGGVGGTSASGPGGYPGGGSYPGGGGYPGR